MAQRPIDPYAEFGNPIQEDEDPFAQFGAPIVEENVPSQPVVPEAPQRSADDILRDAAGALTASESLRPSASPQIPQTPPQTQKGWLDRLVDPLWEAPARWGREIADTFSQRVPRSNTGIAPIDWAANKIQDAQIGAIKLGGDIISGVTSPADLAAAALTGGAGLAVRSGLRGANLLRRGAQAASAIPVAHGVSEIAEGNVIPGAVEAGLGALGVRGIPEPKAPILENLPSLREAEEGLLAVKDYSYSAAPDRMPDLETYVITNNQATPGRAMPPTAIKKVLGTPEVTDAGGNVIRRPVTTQRPIVRSTDPNVVKAVDEAAANNRPAATRIDPNQLAAMPEKPVPTGDPIQDTATWKDYASLPRAIQSAYDLSFPFRQGLGLIHTKGWWQAWPDMVKSVGSEDAFRAVQDSIRARPNFAAAKGQKSFADSAGLQIVDLGNLTKREEEIGSRIAEKIPGVRASNRAYTAFANKLRADTFDSLIEQAEKAGLDPKRNLVLAKEIASYVNTASGRGNIPGGFEGAAVALNQVMFSPRLMASRMQMLNPANYAMGNPMVRRQYMKSALAMGVFWNGMAQMAKELGGAEVNNDPRSSDFRQIKIGDTRIDPSGGLRPYIVLGARLSEILEKNKDRYTGKYGARDPIQDITEFLQNKMSPNAAFATGPLRGDEKFPFYVGDEIAKSFTPIMVQDILELYREDPSLLPLAGLAGVGMGTNTYQTGNRQEEPRMTEPIFPKQYDLRFPRR